MIIFGASVKTVDSCLCMSFPLQQQCCLFIANLPVLVLQRLMPMITLLMIVLSRAHPVLCLMITAQLPIGYREYAMWCHSIILLISFRPLIA